MYRIQISCSWLVKKVFFFSFDSFNLLLLYFSNYVSYFDPFFLGRGVRYMSSSSWSSFFIFCWYTFSMLGLRFTLQFYLLYWNSWLDVSCHFYESLTKDNPALSLIFHFNRLQLSTYDDSEKPQKTGYINLKRERTLRNCKKMEKKR